MTYKFIVKDTEVEVENIMQFVEVLNRMIKEKNICSFPVSQNIVVNWVSRTNGKKSKKYDFVKIYNHKINEFV